LHKTIEPFSNRDISFEVIYEACHRVLSKGRATGPLAPEPDPESFPRLPRPLAHELSLSHRQPRVPVGGGARSLAVVRPARRPPRQTSSPAVLLPGRPSSRSNSSSLCLLQRDSAADSPVQAPRAQLVCRLRYPLQPSSSADLFRQQAWKAG
jgi:hypothetical protein